jgi:hypothetical protein
MHTFRHLLLGVFNYLQPPIMPSLISHPYLYDVVFSQIEYPFLFFVRGVIYLLKSEFFRWYSKRAVVFHAAATSDLPSSWTMRAEVRGLVCTEYVFPHRFREVPEGEIPHFFTLCSLLRIMYS